VVPQQAVINTHVIIVNTERFKTVTLCCEILSGGRDAGLSVEHSATVAFRSPSPGIFAGQAYANSQVRRHLDSVGPGRVEKAPRRTTVYRAVRNDGLRMPLVVRHDLRRARHEVTGGQDLLA
jgi:hypothetical protein